MTKTAISLALAVTLSALLCGCDGKTAANARNFGAAVTQFLDKKGELCLDPIHWPVDVYETDVRQQKLYPDGVAGQMAALESVGLAKSEDAVAPGTSAKVKRYTLADAAKPYLRAKGPQQPRLCYGRKSLDKVVRWADPTKAGDHEESGVIYTYALSDVAAWARKPQVKEAFPVLGRNIDGERSQKEKLYVKSTPEGWEAFGLND